jgi:hypothetical protein
MNRQEKIYKKKYLKYKKLYLKLGGVSFILNKEERNELNEIKSFLDDYILNDLTNNLDQKYDETLNKVSKRHPHFKIHKERCKRMVINLTALRDTTEKNKDKGADFFKKSIVDIIPKTRSLIKFSIKTIPPKEQEILDKRLERFIRQDKTEKILEYIESGANLPEGMDIPEEVKTLKKKKR